MQLTSGRSEEGKFTLPRGMGEGFFWVPWCWQEGRTEMVERDEVISVVVQRWKAFLPLPVASVSPQVTVPSTADPLVIEKQGRQREKG